MTTGAEPGVHAEQRGALAVLTLDRPQALNALTLPMIRGLTAQLDAWAADTRVGAVLLRGRSRADRPAAFCAGGDIRYFHRAWHEGDPQLEDFFTEEYALDHRVHRYPKPVIVLMDGITMGGGMGLAQGAGLRLATQEARLGMPETRIGLFPDVGGGWFLARCPGRLGEFLALTGHVMGAADAVAAGLADEVIAETAQEALIDAVAAATAPDGAGALETARAFAMAPAAAARSAHRALIDRVFSADDVPGVLRALAGEPSTFARDIEAALGACSPLLLAVALRQVRRERAMTLSDALRLERNLMWHAFHGRAAPPEAVEGIRARVIDKDNAPRWNPARIDQVDPAEVDAWFRSPWAAPEHPLAGLED